MPASDYTPSVQDIALMLRARTRDANGDLVSDFTSDTIPTDLDVTGLIQSAVDDVSGAIGPDIDSGYFDTAKVCCVYLASANVELSYFPEQAVANQSMYDKLMTRYNAKLTQLLEDLEMDVGSGGGASDGEMPGAGAWNTIGGGFPDPYWWRYANW
jgi:hypothetical protein